MCARLEGRAQVPELKILAYSGGQVNVQGGRGGLGRRLERRGFFC
jgi:hypothetical protein